MRFGFVFVSEQAQSDDEDGQEVTLQIENDAHEDFMKEFFTEVSHRSLVFTICVDSYKKR
jgi:hypothetical protein